MESVRHSTTVRRVRGVGAVGLLLIVLGLAPGCALLNDNFRPVVRDEFYRSAQMEPGKLNRVLRKHDIRLVINLRGVNPDEEWYVDETRVCAEAGVAHHDFKWSMRHLPTPESLQEFVDLCAGSDKPILVHCQAGVHRTGVASACYVLLKGGSVQAARRQFGVYFHDAPIGRVLDLYEGSDLDFADWCATVYPELYAEAVAQEASSAER